MKGVISYPHLPMTLPFGVLRRWSLYLNRCTDALALKSLDAPGCHVPFLLEPILEDLEGGKYVIPILPISLAEILQKTGGRGSSGGCSGGGTTAKKRNASTTGGHEGVGALLIAPAQPVP